MNAKKFLMSALACGVVSAAAFMSQACGGAQHETTGQTPPPPAQQVAQQATPAMPAAAAHDNDAHDGHAHGPSGRIPAFVSAAEAKQLPPTLAPAQFTGKTRAAYQAVQEMPQTIAQLPCYCHCDVGFGHKSLHSCFQDGHAAQCAVCVEEALTAYRLQKDEKLKPAQIRERIIAEYGTTQ